MPASTARTGPVRPVPVLPADRVAVVEAHDPPLPDPAGHGRRVAYRNTDPVDTGVTGGCLADGTALLAAFDGLAHPCPAPGAPAGGAAPAAVQLGWRSGTSDRGTGSQPMITLTAERLSEPDTR